MSGNLRLRDRPFLRGDVVAHGKLNRTENASRNSYVRRGVFLELGKQGVLFLWLCWAASMSLSFLLGFSFGKRHGVQEALENHSAEVVRLSIPQSQGNIANNIGPDTTVVPSIVPLAPMIEPQAKPLPLEKDEGNSTASLEAVQQGIKPSSESIQWVVQAVTYPTLSRAEAAIKRFEAIKISAHVETVSREGAPYYRVLLGPFLSKEQAIQAKRTVLQKKLVRGRMYLRQFSKAT